MKTRKNVMRQKEPNQNNTVKLSLVDKAYLFAYNLMLNVSQAFIMQFGVLFGCMTQMN